MSYDSAKLLPSLANLQAGFNRNQHRKKIKLQEDYSPVNSDS
jgi:hypothetical protein